MGKLIYLLVFICADYLYAEVLTPEEKKPVDKKIMILFYEVRPENSSSGDIANILTDVLSTEIINNQSFSIIRINDSTLKTELEKRGIAGCQNTDECLLLFSKATDVDYLVSGSAAIIGENYTAILNILDIRQNKLVFRESIMTQKSISEIIGKFIETFNKFAILHKPVKMAEKTETRISDLKSDAGITLQKKEGRENRKSNIVNYLLLGGGVAVMSLGGLFTYNAYVANENFKLGENPDYWSNRVGFYNTLALTSYILGGGLLIASGVMFYMDFDSRE